MDDAQNDSDGQCSDDGQGKLHNEKQDSSAVQSGGVDRHNAQPESADTTGETSEQDASCRWMEKELNDGRPGLWRPGRIARQVTVEADTAGLAVTTT